jgi:hypothetical protein
MPLIWLGGAAITLVAVVGFWVVRRPTWPRRPRGQHRAREWPAAVVAPGAALFLLAGAVAVVRLATGLHAGFAPGEFVTTPPGGHAAPLLRPPGVSPPHAHRPPRAAPARQASRRAMPAAVYSPTYAPVTYYTPAPVYSETDPPVPEPTETYTSPPPTPAPTETYPTTSPTPTPTPTETYTAPTPTQSSGY